MNLNACKLAETPLLMTRDMMKQLLGDLSDADLGAPEQSGLKPEPRSPYVRSRPESANLPNLPRRPNWPFAPFRLNYAFAATD